MKSFAVLALRDGAELPVMSVVNLIFRQSRGPCRMFGLMLPSKFVHKSTSTERIVAERRRHGHGRCIILMSCGIAATTFLNSGRKWQPLCSTS